MLSKSNIFYIGEIAIPSTLYNQRIEIIQIGIFDSEKCVGTSKLLNEVVFNFSNPSNQYTYYEPDIFKGENATLGPIPVYVYEQQPENRAIIGNTPECYLAVKVNNTQYVIKTTFTFYKDTELKTPIHNFTYTNTNQSETVICKIQVDKINTNNNIFKNITRVVNKTYNNNNHGINFAWNNFVNNPYVYTVQNTFTNDSVQNASVVSESSIIYEYIDSIVNSSTSVGATFVKGANEYVSVVNIIYNNSYNFDFKTKNIITNEEFDDSITIETFQSPATIAQDNNSFIFTDKYLSGVVKTEYYVKFYLNDTVKTEKPINAAKIYLNDTRIYIPDFYYTLEVIPSEYKDLSNKVEFTTSYKYVKVNNIEDKLLDDDFNI